MASESSTILPGSAVGILGGGQLGRMFAIAARRMGYRVHTFSPDNDTPAGQVADVEVKATYEDLQAVRDFASQVSVVTFEFENVSAAAAGAAAEVVPVRPHGDVLHTAQHRLREKTFLSGHGFPVTPFAAIRKSDEIPAAVAHTKLPAVLKTAGFGYDGKGQWKVQTVEQIQHVLSESPGGEFVLEAIVDFEKEVSVVAARGMDGSFAHWGVIENDHRSRILDLSIAPAQIPTALQMQAIDITRSVMDELDAVGVLCVEFFVTKSGRLLVNEVAPRPHNSGHLTIDASVTSQFEQQLRAVCGLPLGSTRFVGGGAAMANLLGDEWSQGEPNWPAALAMPNVKLHLYGKNCPRPGRKMGHLTATADTPQEAARIVRQAREALSFR
jgi:5-(carboxyamino)imidazole ribonucleotide synthase